MSEQKSYLKAGIWYMVGNILIKGVSFIALPIFTRLLTPEDFGRYNIFMSYESILTIILGLGFGGTIKIAYFDFKDNFKDYFSSVIFFTILFTLVFDVLSIGCYFIFLRPHLSEMWTQGLLHLLIFSALGTALYNLISTKYVIYAEYKSNLAISAIYTITNSLDKGNQIQRKNIIEEELNLDKKINNEDFLVFLSKHSFGNFAVQKFLEYSDEQTRINMIERIYPLISILFI